MRLAISTRAARAAALAAASARVFLGLCVDAPTTRNGAWLSALLGALLAAPWLLCIVRARGKQQRSLAPLLTVALLSVCLLDASAVLSALSRSAGYLTLDRSPALTLALPGALILLWCVLRGGDAIGYAAMLWLRIAIAMLVVVVLLQWRYLRAGWLAPVLGGGWPAIVDGGIRAAGWIVASCAILALPQDANGARDALPVLAMLGGSTLATTALILLRQMMAPTMAAGDTWLNRLDALLCNGRAPLYLQLPLIALWFAGLAHLLACECWTAAALLSRLSPRLDARLCALAVVAAVLALSRAALPAALYLRFHDWCYAGIGALTALALLPAKKRGGVAGCA